MEFMILTWESDDRQDVEYDSDEEYEHTAFHTFLFGVDRDGRSVCLDVFNCNYELFIKIPDNFSSAKANDTIKLCKGLLYPALKVDVKRVDVVKRIDGYGYCDRLMSTFVKFELSSRKSFYMLKKAFSKNPKLNKLKLYNGSLSPMLLMMHKRNILASGWVTVDRRYLVDAPSIANTDLCYMVDAKHIQPLDYHVIPPLKVMSWDIEVFSEDGQFPDATRPLDKVIQIGYTCMRYGQDHFEQKVLVLGECDCDDVTTVSFDTEKALIKGFSDALSSENPDVLIGYNVNGFDWMYLKMRCDLHNMDLDALGRLKGVPSAYTESDMESSAYGKNIFNYYTTPGITQIDLYNYFRRETKLDSYKLDNVAKIFLGEKKNEVTPQQIFRWGGPEGTPKERGVVASYCAKDTLLPLRLLTKQMVLQNLVEMSKCTYVPLSWLITRGQQIKVYSQIMKEFRLRRIVFPDKINVDNFEKFEGATVLNCERGLHLCATLGLDFASLYPSIIIAHNLCPTTFVLNNGNYDHAPHGTFQRFKWEQGDYMFAEAETQRGVVPEILERLWVERKRVKKEMKGEKDPILYAILNAKQLAIKVSMNSIYGVFGSNVGYLPIKPIAATVTYLGRTMIAKSREIAETFYKGASTSGGIKAHVVYGDSVTPRTSVMVRRENKIEFKEIQNIAETEWVAYPEFKPDGEDRTHKERANSSYEVWDGTNWTAIRKVIRHKVNKKIYKVSTQTGYVEVTEDHSLIRGDMTYVKPNDLKPGDKLFHGYPEVDAMYDRYDIMLMQREEAKFPIERQIEASEYFYKMKAAHIDVCLNVFEDTIYIFGKGYGYQRAMNDDDTVVTYRDELIGEQDYVYDIETESGHFQAGVGSLIVKNTDSIYTRFTIPNIEHLSKEEQIERHAAVGAECAERISRTFRKPIQLEFEQVMWNLLLVTKKRYAYQGWEPGKKGMECKGLKVKGLQVVRRDNCKFVKKIGNALLHQIIEESDPEGAKQTAKRMIVELLSDKVPTEELIISKQLRGSYTTTNKLGNEISLPAHAELAARMKRRDPVGAPKAGDRVQYVFVENLDKHAKQCDRIENPDWVRAHPDRCKIDSVYYFEHQIKEPILTILSCLIKNSRGETYPLVAGKVDPRAKEILEKLWRNELRRRVNKRNGQRDLASFWTRSQASQT